MPPRALTSDEANAAFDIITSIAGATGGEDERYAFVLCLTKKAPITTEYRFIGRLGFGGKFRNNRNRPTPYVDCYPEDLTPDRQTIIERTNQALSLLFGHIPETNHHE